MKEFVFKVYIDGIFYKTFRNKEIKEFFIDWNDKLSEGQVIKTTKGNVKVLTASIENPAHTDREMVTEVKLTKL